MAFQRGEDPNRYRGGRKKGAINRMTIARAALTIEPLESVLALPGAFRGSPAELLRSMMADPRHPIDMRLAAAGQLLRESKGEDRSSIAAQLEELRAARARGGGVVGGQVAPAGEDPESPSDPAL